MQCLRTLLSSFGEDIFKSLANRNKIFAFFYFQSFAKMPVGDVSL